MTIDLDILRQPERIELHKFRTDGGTQPRAGLDSSTVDEYTAAMNEGATFPPVVVFHDGTDYWLADGFHRYHAHKIAHPASPILADVRQGDRRDAVLHSVGANAEHGLRRTNEDKRRAVMRLLNDEEWSQWSDREIARRARVSNRFVTNLRNDPSVNRSQIDDTTRSATRNGVTYTIDTSNIGKAQPAPAPTDKPLVDWKDEDWANHNAKIEAAIADAADEPNQPINQSPVPPSDNSILSPDQPDPVAPAQTEEETQAQRLRILTNALTQSLMLLHDANAQTAEDYGFGIEFDRLISDAMALEIEFKQLTPADRINS